ncbi:phenylacetate--CoA ligase family protein [Mycobacterium sp. Y57]|uniref:phenylacetate--CoA ligase family protein n=1 Tax=Mycolicibacterium xanthum TaxID=2796469 RepID=UPI001C8462AE|nr:phenylacetate--CoA ligase family protein [Mycolicibacterium xanthum]MBX7434703.1 phenylacetate--CoA ligase family protein [Mycolicibacterium xanthum]
MSLSDLPVTDKPELMARFDDWVTDRRITRADVEAFVADSSLSGIRFLDEYFVCRSSGTTGRPGIFVADRAAIATTYACYAFGAVRGLRRARWRRLLAKRMRQARVVGTGGHFAGAGIVTMAQRDSKCRTQREQLVSVGQPLGEMVSQLNTIDPAILEGYPSAIHQLAQEQRAGRLQIRPSLVATGGETVSIDARRTMAAAFEAPVIDAYVSSECLLVATTCRHEWLHYRSDWMILEPVDADYQPVPPGQPSYTVLLTDLSNRVQPIIRYDLGDSVLARPDPCDCGSPLPAIRVIGRCDDVLRFAANGTVVEVLPLAITAGLEDVDGLDRVQLIQQDPTLLAVRFSCKNSEQRAQVWTSVSHLLRVFLDRQGLRNVSLRDDHQPPDLVGASGKYRQVIGTSLDR